MAVCPVTVGTYLHKIIFDIHLKFKFNKTSIEAGPRWQSRNNLSPPPPVDTSKLQLNIDQLFLRMTL